MLLATAPKRQRPVVRRACRERARSEDIALSRMAGPPESVTKGYGFGAGCARRAALTVLPVGVVAGAALDSISAAAKVCTAASRARVSSSAHAFA